MIYNKKQMNGIITKIIMKLILRNKEIDKNNIIKYMNDYNIHESVIHYFKSISKQRLKSFNDLANKQIKNFNYKNEMEILLNDIEFNTFSEHSDLSLNENKNISLKNIKDNILSLLYAFKRNNINMKF